MTPLLDVRGLTVEVRAGRRPVRLLDDVGLTIGRGEAVGLVGESGSGKSMTAASILDLFGSRGVRVTAGEILLEGRDLRTLPPAALRKVRGASIGMVFQDPSSHLDPLLPVGRQIAETLELHGRAKTRRERVRELLALMGFPDPDTVAARYPHELSGGMRQRVMIAAALAMSPALLIADEPTTALDVTVQAGILDLLTRLRRELGLAILLITHDLGIVAETCQRAYVMYAGRVVETNDVAGLFAEPRHPYTKGLLASIIESRAADGDLFSIPGRVPAPAEMPDACRFHPRCPLALPTPCRTDPPPLTARVTGGADRCWRAEEPAARMLWAREAAAAS